MFGHIFGRFLVEQKMISQETLEEVLDAQRKVRETFDDCEFEVLSNENLQPQNA